MHQRPSLNTFYLLVALLVLALSGLACATLSSSLPTASPFPTQVPSIAPVIASPTAIPSLTPLPTITRLPPTPTASPSPTRPPRLPTVTRAPSTLPIKLPTPLYLIDAATKQIVRLETDGKTVTQITSEAKPVIDFDVSPADGSLAYVSDNDLILTNAMGRNRKILVNGDTLNEKELTTKDYWTRIIDAPRWSPDGKQIAYGMGGINLVAPTDGRLQLIQPNDPNDFDPVKSGGARRFTPVSWSPNGAHLLLWFRWYIEAGGHAIKNFSDKRLVQFVGSSYPGNISWSTTSSHVYLADRVTALGWDCSGGLELFDASTGKNQTLITAADNPKQSGAPTSTDDCAMVIAPYHASADRLYLFLAFSTLGDLFYPQPPPSVSYGMYRAEANGSKRVLLREDIDNVLAALWAPDASGAVVISGKESWISGDNTEILWVPADGSKPLVLLPVNGGNLRWGK